MTAEFHTDFDHWLNVINNTLGRIAEALESRQCNAAAPDRSTDPTSPTSAPPAGDGLGGEKDGSHAPSAGPSAPGGVSPSSPSSSSSGPAGATGSSDSARRALADNNRPAWLTREAASTLPEGTERVRECGSAFPSGMFWSKFRKVWDSNTAQESDCDKASCGVYHLPPAAKGEARVPESALIAQAVPGLEAERERLAGRREGEKGEGDAWSRLCKLSGHDAMDWMPITPEEFNAFVAGECERAVKALEPKFHDVDQFYEEPPKPDAGRAEGVKCPTCGGTAEPSVIEGRFVCKDSECPVFSFAPVPTPAPKPSPGEVAEGIFRQAFMTHGPIRDALVPLIEAAIVRERSTLGH